MMLQFLVWLIFSCILMSFIEHQVHARLMHRRFFLADKIAALAKVYKNHAVNHHATYAFIFSDDPVPKGTDRGIRLNVKEGLYESIPFAALLACLSWIAAICFVSIVILHHCLWNLIHLEMHKPEQRFFSNWRVYKFLARHHMMHHKYPMRNFNVVFPIADYVLGTAVKPGYAEKAEFYRMGLLPRQAAIKRVVHNA
ncbi:MAG TPA: hypothetical protein V6C89_15140 [Drouetiella sp.]